MPREGAPEILWGRAGVREVAVASGADLVVSAMVGAVGLEPTLAAIHAGLPVALANKETLVAAGSLVMAAAKERACPSSRWTANTAPFFRPCTASAREDVRHLWLTASGGPFRAWDLERLRGATAAQALKHPNWSMGPKITIDSAPP